MSEIKYSVQPTDLGDSNFPEMDEFKVSFEMTGQRSELIRAVEAVLREVREA